MSDDEITPVNLDDDQDVEEDADAPGDPGDEIDPPEDDDPPDQGGGADEGPDPATVDAEPSVVDLDEKEV